MSRLIYTTNVSLDGFIEDESGRFDWTAPDEEYHKHINDREREVGTYLYGRRIYETMAVWETDPSLAAQSPILADYARIWQAADKIVYSSTLQSPFTARTSIEPRFEPEAVRRLVESSARDVSVAGAELAAQAFKAGLVDEMRLYVDTSPRRRRQARPPAGRVLRLDLLDEHRFASGVVHLRYRVTR